MHIQAYDKAVWESPSVCTIKTEAGITDILAKRASVANDLEALLGSTNPLNVTALKAARNLVEVFKTGKPTDIITVGYPEFDETKSSANNLIQTGKHVTLWEVTRDQVLKACNLVLKANEAKKQGDIVSYMIFIPLNELPNNGYKFGNSAKEGRGKRASGLVTF